MLAAMRTKTTLPSEADKSLSFSSSALVLRQAVNIFDKKANANVKKNFQGFESHGR